MHAILLPRARDIRHASGSVLGHNAVDAQQVRTNGPKNRSNFKCGVEFSALRSPSVLAKSAEMRRIRIPEKTIAYEDRTKSAQSGGLERNGLTERISGSDQTTAVRRFGREGPRILRISARPDGAREALQKTDWRRERDSNPRYGFPQTRFPSVRLQPLGHPSAGARRTQGKRRVSALSRPAGQGAHYSQGRLSRKRQPPKSTRTPQDCI